MTETHPRLNHVNIVTLDLDAMCDFLKTYFGMVAGPKVHTKASWVAKITGYDDPSVTFVAMSVPNQPDFRIEVLTFQNPESPAVQPDTWHVNKPGFRHICFSMTDIHVKYKELKDAGYEFLSEPVLVEEMKVWTCYFIGPENLLIQLLQGSE